MHQPHYEQRIWIYRRSNVLLISVLLFVILGNILWLVTLENRYYWTDEAWYAENAIALLSGNPYVDAIRRSPGTVWFLAIWAKVFGGTMLSWRLSNLFLGVISSIICFQIAARIFQKRMSCLLASLLCLCYPFFVYIRGFLLSENLAILLIALFVWSFLLICDSDSSLGWVGSGLLAGAANLARPTLLFIPIFIPLILAIRHQNLTKIIRNTIIFALGFSLVMGLWLFRNYHIGGRASLSSFAFREMYKGAVTPHGREISTFPVPPTEEMARKELITFVRNDFILLLKHKLHSAMRFWSPVLDHVETKQHDRVFSIFTWCILLPLYFLAALGWMSANQRGKVVLLGVILAYWAFHVLAVVKFRYRIPLDLLLLVLASGGLCSIADLLWPRLAFVFPKTVAPSQRERL